MVESNPYATPPASGVTGSAGDVPLGRSTAMIHQIRVVAILLIIHGFLAIAMGLFYVAIGLLMPYIAPASQNPFAQGNQQQFNFMLWIYFAMAGPALIAGGLQIVAGWRVYDLRSRKLGIAAVLSGIVASSTCYCGPTGFMLAIYGSIVLFNSTVAQAFRWRAEGATANQVFARLFAPDAPWAPAPRPAPAMPPTGPAAAEGSADESRTEPAPPPSHPPGSEPPTTMP